MAVTSPTLPNLDGLIGLARRDGVDVRPTLVRVLTDLYVQKRSHTPDEEHRYTELTLSLLAAVDVPTRAAVAKKLATYAQAPRLVARRLARDVFDVAEPILKSSPCLTSDDLLEVIRDFGPRYAAAIGERHRPALQPAEEPCTAAGQAAGPSSADACGGSDAGDLGRGEARSQSRRPEGSSVGTTLGPRVSLGEYFLHATSPERRLMLANLEDGTVTPSERAFAERTGEAISQLEAAALGRRPDAFVAGLERTLRVPAETAQRIVADETGEPLMVAARALSIPSDVLLRILLFLNPVIGHSVERVFSLVDLYDQLSAEAALHLVSSWQAAHPAAKQTAPHQPVHWDDETRGARRTFADHPRRLAPRGADGRPTAVPPRVVGQRTT
jgi:hypothetical protein